MVLSQDLKSQLKKLFEEKKFSEVEFLIESSIKDEDKSSGILNLLGASKINKNNKDKANLISGLKDFEKGYIKEKETKNGLICLQNFIKTSVDLYDLDNSDLVLDKVFDNFNNAIDFWKYDKKLIIVVCDNGGHMVINRLQLAKGGKEYICNLNTARATNLQFVDFDQHCQNPSNNHPVHNL